MRERAPFDCVIDMICYQPEDARSLVRAFSGHVGHLIVCSTVDVYEKPQRRLPITENTPHAPAPWDYAVNKARCEAILREAHGRGVFPLTVLRPAHTYHDGGTIVHSLGGKTTYLDRLRHGKPIVVHGDGSSLWVSAHAEDVSRAFAEAAGNERAFGNSYHLPGEEWFTWNRYHETVAEAIGAPAPRFVHIPTDLLARAAPQRANLCAVNFQYHNIFDTTAARADLDFRYTIPLRDGAARLYHWLDQHGGIEDSDADPLDDRLIAAWERLSAAMIRELSE